MPILIIAIMIALFVAGAFYAHHMSAKRREELAAWAMQHGLSFSAEKEGGDGSSLAYLCGSATR